LNGGERQFADEKKTQRLIKNQKLGVRGDGKELRKMYGAKERERNGLCCSGQIVNVLAN